jgi:hypothetical protein
MKKIKLTKGDIVKILWTDTNIPTETGWMSESKHNEWTSSCSNMVVSVGIYISENKKFIHLVGDMEEK